MIEITDATQSIERLVNLIKREMGALNRPSCGMRVHLQFGETVTYRVTLPLRKESGAPRRTAAPDGAQQSKGKQR